MSLSVSQIVSKFLVWSGRVHAPRTTDAYRHQLAKFAARFGRRRASALHAFHLQECGQTWHLYQAVQRCFNWACAARLVKRNPFNEVRRPPIGERKRIASRIERVQMLRAAKRSLRALLLAFRETFARPQELRAATWNDLMVPGDSSSPDMAAALPRGQACLVLWEYKSRRQRHDSNKPRVILISPRAGRLLLRLMQRRLPGVETIFTSPKGRAWTANALRCCFRRLRRRMKLKRDRHGENIVPYTFRHTGATEAAAKGIRDRVLAEILGHTSTRTTARYQHLNIEHLREAMQRLWGFPPR